MIQYVWKKNMYITKQILSTKVLLMYATTIKNDKKNDISLH